MVLRIGNLLIFDICVNCRWLVLKVIFSGKFSEDPLFQNVPTPEIMEGYPKIGPASLVTAGKPIKEPGAWDQNPQTKLAPDLTPTSGATNKKTSQIHGESSTLALVFLFSHLSDIKDFFLVFFGFYVLTLLLLLWICTIFVGFCIELSDPVRIPTQRQARLFTFSFFVTSSVHIL